MEGKESCIQDRSIYEDAEIFANNLHAIGKMDERDFHNYRELYSVMMEYLQPPDLLISLMQKLKHCSNKLHCAEENTSNLFITYRRTFCIVQNWIGNYKIGNLLVIPSDEVDFVHERGG